MLRSLTSLTHFTLYIATKIDPVILLCCALLHIVIIINFLSPVFAGAVE